MKQESTQMRKSYLLVHWIFTLVLAPFVSHVLQYFLLPNPHQIGSLLEVYPITLPFSIVFSIPTLIVYLGVFYLLVKKPVSIFFAKCILMSTAALGIIITMTIIGGTMMSQQMAIDYSITSLIVGLLAPLQSRHHVKKSD